MAKEEFTSISKERIESQLEKQRCMQGMFYALESY
jgi:hypothetical protein